MLIVYNDPLCELTTLHPLCRRTLGWPGVARCRVDADIILALFSGEHRCALLVGMPKGGCWVLGYALYSQVPTKMFPTGLGPIWCLCVL